MSDEIIQDKTSDKVEIEQEEVNKTFAVYDENGSYFCALTKELHGDRAEPIAHLVANEINGSVKS